MAGAKLLAEGASFQKGAHPTQGCTSLSLAGMRPLAAPQPAGPTQGGETESLSKLVFQRLQRAVLGSFPTLNPRVGDKQQPQKWCGGGLKSQEPGGPGWDLHSTCCETLSK